MRARVCMCVWVWLVRKDSVCLFDNNGSKWQLFMLSMDTDVKLDVRDLYFFLGPCSEQTNDCNSAYGHFSYDR